jgi:uncharacterized phosphosugar-binding protein
MKGEGMTATGYLQAVRQRIDQLEATQMPAIEEAGQMVADAIANGHRIWMTRTNHGLFDEATYRAGGFMAVHPLGDPISVEPGDVVIAATNAGVNPNTIDTALAVKQRKAILIALSQHTFEKEPTLLLVHESGQKLHELADLAIDLGGEVGDGELPFLDTGFRIIPSSGVTGALAIWMIFASAADRLIAAGAPPLMWQAIQLAGATEYNHENLRRYRETGLGYQGPTTGQDRGSISG